MSTFATVVSKLPKVVFVKFTDSKGNELSWTLPGLTERGLYPLVPKSASWFLDKGRAHPVLRIIRTQLPTAPAFAMTSHGAQGQTLKKGCIVDLCIGKGASPLGSYVGLTRVANRTKLLIHRLFERELFSRGQKEGPDLLLKHLRGEKIDWKAIEEEHTPCM